MHLSSALAWMSLNTEVLNSCWTGRPCCIRDHLLVGPCSCWCSWTVQALSQIRSLAPVHAPWLGICLNIAQYQSSLFILDGSTLLHEGSTPAKANKPRPGRVPGLTLGLVKSQCSSDMFFPCHAQLTCAVKSTRDTACSW